MAISSDRLQQLGEIAKVDVDAMTSGQKQALIGYANALLGRFSSIADDAIEHASPLIHPGDPQTWMRDDDVQASLGARRALAHAPVRDDQSYIVPRVVDDNA